MLRRILDNSHYCFHHSFDSWQEAIRASYEPLHRDGIVNDSYIDSVIGCVKEYGPYIVVVKDVAMPHSSSSFEGCTKTAVSFMRVQVPVMFERDNRESDAQLFFSLSIRNEDEHIKNIQSLMLILENQRLLDDLKGASNEEMFRDIVFKYS